MTPLCRPCNTQISGIRSCLLVYISLIIHLSKEIHSFSTNVPLQNPGLKRKTLLSRQIRPDSYSDIDDDLKGIDMHELQERRKFAKKISSMVTLAALGEATITSTSASAYERAYPTDLDFEDGDRSRDLAAARKISIDRKKADREKSMNYVESTNPLSFRGPKDLLTATVWGGALWFLLGSRSNPLVTPLANVLYNEEDEVWLKDRNDGLFGSIPVPLFILLGVVFFFLGIATDRIVLLASEGSANVSLQLAGVSLIGGGALELGRIASGEKKQTREDYDRETQLIEEFAEFAERRLTSGGNCHRSEVSKAFRRYFAKYRDADSVEYPLSDLEIERLFRAWNRSKGNPEMSSAGFFTGVQINQGADVTLSR